MRCAPSRGDTLDVSISRSTANPELASTEPNARPCDCFRAPSLALRTLAGAVARTKIISKPRNASVQSSRTSRSKQSISSITRLTICLRERSCRTVHPRKDTTSRGAVSNCLVGLLRLVREAVSGKWTRAAPSFRHHRENGIEREVQKMFLRLFLQCFCKSRFSCARAAYNEDDFSCLRRSSIPVVPQRHTAALCQCVSVKSCAAR